MFINFRDIPGQQNIFLDYLYEFESVKPYYIKNFRKTDSYPSHFEEVLSKYKTDRNSIAKILKNQYLNKRISAKTAYNLKMISDPSTLFVFTGQQLGIATGPLYTFYKIITTIKLAHHLSTKYPGYNFVPAFWLAGDDHDFEEIRSVTLLNNDNSPVIVTYGEIEESGNVDNDLGSVGFLKIEDEIDLFISKVNESLRPTEFTPAIISILYESYKKGKTFADAFKDLLFKFFDKHGLIIVNPQDKELKSLLKPIFKNELENFRTHAEKLVSNSAGLEEVYHAQVKIKPLNLFYHYGKGRYSVEPVDHNEFKLRRKKVKFTKEELNNLIETEPENFSANVVLRPICQDFLFPSAFYVAGPAEVSYYAQIIPLFSYFQLPVPMVFPRAGATILERNVSVLSDKFGLQISDFFVRREDVIKLAASRLSGINLEEIFEKAGLELSETIEYLKNALQHIDKTLLDPSDKLKLRIVSGLEELKKKAEIARIKRNESTLNQVKKALNLILPNGILQEREINIIYFMNKYGIDFHEKLFEELEILAFEHQIIKI